MRRSALPRGVPFQTGGDAVELVMRRAVVWADAPARFEAGTPGIVNVITLAKALREMEYEHPTPVQVACLPMAPWISAGWMSSRA